MSEGSRIGVMLVCALLSTGALAGCLDGGPEEGAFTFRSPQPNANGIVTVTRAAADDALGLAPMMDTVCGLTGALPLLGSTQPCREPEMKLAVSFPPDGLDQPDENGYRVVAIDSAGADVAIGDSLAEPGVDGWAFETILEPDTANSLSHVELRMGDFVLATAGLTGEINAFEVNPLLWAVKADGKYGGRSVSLTISGLPDIGGSIAFLDGSAGDAPVASGRTPVQNGENELVADRDVNSLWGLRLYLGDSGIRLADASMMTTPPFVKNEKLLGNSTGEPTIAVDPTDPDTIVVTGTLKDVWYTSNGGSTWNASSVNWIGNVDPYIVVDSQGYFYTERQEYQDGDDRINVSRSTDGGVTWGANASVWIAGLPVYFNATDSHDVCQISNPFDGTRMAADWSDTSGYEDNVYVLLAGAVDLDDDGTCDYSGVVPAIARSTDGGATWQRNGWDVSAGPVAGNAVGPSGILFPFVGWGADCPGGGGLGSSVKVARSTDQGQNITTSACVPGLTIGRGLSVSGIAPHPTNAGTIYAVIQDQGKGNIFVSKSLDAGSTWLAPVKVSEHNVTASNVALWPTIDVSSTGRIDVAWRDTRQTGEDVNACYSNKTCDIYYAYSTDGGLTFSDNVRLTPESRRMMECNCAPHKYNDFSSIVSAGNKAYAAYSFDLDPNGVRKYTLFVTTIAFS